MRCMSRGPLSTGRRIPVADFNQTWSDSTLIIKRKKEKRKHSIIYYIKIYTQNTRAGSSRLAPLHICIGWFSWPR